MIKTVIRLQNNQIIEIEVSGHANSAEYGKDLVCAGVSTTCVGIANALVQRQFLEKEMGTLDVKDGYVHIKVNHSENDIQVVLETFVTIMETIEEAYSKYMKITKMEV